jgi:hypothetical protein
MLMLMSVTSLRKPSHACMYRVEVHTCSDGMSHVLQYAVYSMVSSCVIVNCRAVDMLEMQYKALWHCAC